MNSIKSGVDLSTLTPIQCAIWIVVASVYEYFNTECQLTDGGRKRGPNDSLSMHHVGRALDFKLNHVDPDTAWEIEHGCAERLGDAFDVMAHGAGAKFHLHAEYDPKEG